MGFQILESRRKSATALIQQEITVERFCTQQGWQSKGYNNFVPCPFHDDISPSMSFDLVNNRWYCFACGKGGYIVSLIQRYYEKCRGIHLSYNNTIERIIKDYPDIRDKLGFTSIYMTESEAIKVSKDSEGTLVVDIPERRSPKIVSTVTFSTLLNKLAQQNNLDNILAFISDCENGLSEEILLKKYYYESYSALDLLGTQASEDDIFKLEFQKIFGTEGA